MSYGDNTPTWSEAQILTACRILHQVDTHRVAHVAYWIALTVAVDESDVLVLGSDREPASHSSQWIQGDAQGDHLSVGVFQQQDPWGPLDKRMNPYGATERFLRGGDSPGTPGLLSIDGWEHLAPWDAATRVQRNADGAAAYVGPANRAAGLLRALGAR